VLTRSPALHVTVVSLHPGCPAEQHDGPSTDVVHSFLAIKYLYLLLGTLAHLPTSHPLNFPARVRGFSNMSLPCLSRRLSHLGSTFGVLHSGGFMGLTLDVVMRSSTCTPH
jgi:hypothetical protein